ncbi:hypothetical protein BDB01DRAFT_806890 [Pilobolus umbonatus]|nr:hypothetical protein BDB01DRAFT_806890 [Pilobolus umbonatus]
MDNKDTTKPLLCVAGCGFYGNELFNNMCSKCYKLKKTAAEDSKVTMDKTKEDLPEEPSLLQTSTPPVLSTQDTLTRKHFRTPSPDRGIRHSAPVSSIPSPSTSSVDTAVTSEKPIQTNKGRCYKCRVKVPLAKQAANKCRCSYVFCDNHRYPDRHDCEIDYAKLDREILAKNNPKLHQRPKGGRSFQRIDSL